MIERGWYDREFIRTWSNGPMLVRADNGRMLTEGDLTPGGEGSRNVAWDIALAYGRDRPYDGRLRKSRA